MSDRLGARGVVTEPIASPSPTSRIRPASSGSRSPSTVSLLGPEARSLSLSRLSPFATLRPSTATFGGLDRSSLSRDLMNELEEAERSTLRSGYEELRAAVRELQRQVKQAPRSWRSEIEAKLGESHQDVLDNFLKDFRGEIDSKVEQAVRTQLRHSSAVEQSFEAFKTSTLREINGLRVELANAVSALPPGPEMYALDMQGSRAQLEARLALVEQQVQSLRASTRSPSPLATEQRLGELEAKLWEQRSQMGVQQEQLQQIRESILSESASSFSRQMQALQGQLEELKDTSREGLRAHAADLSSLEAGFDTWRQRVDQVLLESEQKLNQEVESRMQASQERLNAEMRANATSAEAENIRKKWEQTVAQDLRQLTAQVSSLETQLQVHSQDTGTSHVSGLAQRLSAAESSIVEEQSKREVLARQLEERMETLGEVTAARVATGVEALQGYVTSPRSREVARMAVQVDANEKEMKRLLKEIQGVEVALERVLADQRMLQDQAEDSSRERTSRFEERRGSERMERKLKARLEELEAKVEQLASSEGLVEVIVRVEEQKKILQEQDARQRQVEEALKEAQPMLKQLQEQDDRWQKGLEAAQQLQRQHLELRSQLEGHKDVVEVRCLERLELQGKRMEEVAKRMEHLEENAKSSLLQVATTSGESKRPLLDLERRLQSSEQQLEDVLEKLNQHDTSLGQHSREVKKDLQQMLEKQRKVEQQQGDLKKELLQVQELHDQLMTSCGNTQAELNKHAKSIGEVESNAVDSIQQKSYRMETSIAKLDPRIASLEETVKDLIQELGSRLRGFDSSLLQLEPRVAIVESQMPRLQDASKMVAVLSSEARSNSEAAQSRIGRLESDVLKLTSSAEKAEPAIERIQAWMEKSDERLGRLSAQSEAMEEHRGSTQQNVVKMEATCKKVNQQVESSLERLANFEYRLTAFDGRLSGLEPLADLQSSLAELKHQSSSLEVRTQSLQAHQKLLQTNGEAVLGEHRALAQQVAEEHLVLLEVKKESNSSKEDLQQLKLRTEGVEREMQQANKAQEYVQNDMTEFQQAMEQAQQRLKTELQSRLEESRAALEKQTRSLCVLQHSRQDIEHAIEGMKRELAKEKAAASTAASAAASAAEEAAHSATSAVEATKEALQEQAKQKEELLKNFDTWKLEALEEAARRVLEAQEVAVGDLMKTMDRHRYQTKEDTLKTREELLQVMTSNNNLFDGKVVDLQQRLQLLAMEAGRSLGDLNGDLERLRRGDSTLQESTLDLTLPGLRDLRGAVTDEQKRRHQEAQRLGERLQEQCRDHKLGSGGRLSQYQEPSHEEKVSFTVLDGLKGCEVALTAMDRRVTNLEDCLEDKLYDLVRMDANKRAALQQGHLQEMEQKVDKLVHTLHTPSGHETASFSAPGPLHSRDAWREQFRSALNDSSYVKRALQTTRA